MTELATMLPTGFATEIDGTAVLVVGHVHSFPSHPARGADVQPFDGGDDVVTATGVVGAPLYALVSVTWATQVTTVDVAAGTSVAEYVPGFLGTPRGTTWYLHPAVHDAETGSYQLDSNGYAASGYGAAVPAHVRAAVVAPSADGQVPGNVKVHDFPLH